MPSSPHVPCGLWFRRLMVTSTLVYHCWCKTRMQQLPRCWKPRFYQVDLNSTSVTLQSTKSDYLHWYPFPVKRKRPTSNNKTTPTPKLSNTFLYKLMFYLWSCHSTYQERDCAWNGMPKNSSQQFASEQTFCRCLHVFLPQEELLDGWIVRTKTQASGSNCCWVWSQEGRHVDVLVWNVHVRLDFSQNMSYLSTVLTCMRHNMW